MINYCLVILLSIIIVLQRSSQVPEDGDPWAKRHCCQAWAANAKLEFSLGHLPVGEFGQLKPSQLCRGADAGPGRDWRPWRHHESCLYFIFLK